LRRRKRSANSNFIAVQSPKSEQKPCHRGGILLLCARFIIGLLGGLIISGFALPPIVYPVTYNRWSDLPSYYLSIAIGNLIGLAAGFGLGLYKRTRRLNLPWFIIGAVGALPIAAVLVFPKVNVEARMISDPRSRWPAYFAAWAICGTIGVLAGLLLESFKCRRNGETKNSQD
jgi:hypothetical protein